MSHRVSGVAFAFVRPNHDRTFLIHTFSRSSLHYTCSYVVFTNQSDDDEHLGRRRCRRRDQKMTLAAFGSTLQPLFIALTDGFQIEGQKEHETRILVVFERGFVFEDNPTNEQKCVSERSLTVPSSLRRSFTFSHNCSDPYERLTAINCHVSSSHHLAMSVTLYVKQRIVKDLLQSTFNMMQFSESNQQDEFIERLLISNIKAHFKNI